MPVFSAAPSPEPPKTPDFSPFRSCKKANPSPRASIRQQQNQGERRNYKQNSERKLNTSQIDSRGSSQAKQYATGYKGYLGHQSHPQHELKPSTPPLHVCECGIEVTHKGCHTSIQATEQHESDVKSIHTSPKQSDQTRWFCQISVPSHLSLNSYSSFAMTGRQCHEDPDTSQASSAST